MSQHQKRELLLDPHGTLAWVAARLPGCGRALPPNYRMLTVGADGAAYMRADGLSVIMSGAIEQDGKRWLHVSCARASRLPSWEELREVKDVFIGTETYAFQVLPPQDRYINIHNYCLHLFACVDGHPLPDFTRGGRTL